LCNFADKAAESTKTLAKVNKEFLMSEEVFDPQSSYVAARQPLEYPHMSYLPK
jgi:hypothetical protein